MFFEKTSFSILRRLPTRADRLALRSFPQIFGVFPVENSDFCPKSLEFPQGCPQPVENFFVFRKNSNRGERKTSNCAECTKKRRKTVNGEREKTRFRRTRNVYMQKSRHLSANICIQLHGYARWRAWIKGVVAFIKATTPRAFPCPLKRPFLPVTAKKSGSLATNSIGISNICVFAANIWGCRS